MSRPRIVFFGTPAFALPALERVLTWGAPVAGVVTQPDRPRGRGQHVSAGAVKRFAVARGLPVLQPERLRDDAFIAAFTALRAELAVVAAYGKILPEALLALPPLGFINVHASLLPRYRGASPVQRAVMAGDTETGVSIMRIVRELDAGPVFASAPHPIGPDDTADQVERALADLGAALLIDVIEQLADGRARETAQDSSLATFAPRLTPDDGPIDWIWPAKRIHDHVRGLHPWPHACTYAGGKRVILLRTSLAAALPPAAPGARTREPGEVLAAAGGVLTVVCGDGRALQLDVLQPEGRRPMTAREYMAGRRLQPGQRFTGR